MQASRGHCGPAAWGRRRRWQQGAGSGRTCLAPTNATLCYPCKHLPTQICTAMAGTDAPGALTAALQACGPDPPSSPAAAWAALGAADAAARALLCLAADPVQHTGALDSAIKCVGGSLWERCDVAWLAAQPACAQRGDAAAKEGNAAACRLVQPCQARLRSSGRTACRDSTASRRMNSCPFASPACSAVAHWAQALERRLDPWEVALGPQPSGPEKSALVRPAWLLRCRVAGCGTIGFAAPAVLCTLGRHCAVPAAPVNLC